MSDETDRTNAAPGQRQAEISTSIPAARWRPAVIDGNGERNEVVPGEDDAAVDLSEWLGEVAADFSGETVDTAVLIVRTPERIIVRHVDADAASLIYAAWAFQRYLDRALE